VTVCLKLTDYPLNYKQPPSPVHVLYTSAGKPRSITNKYNGVVCKCPLRTKSLQVLLTCSSIFDKRTRENQFHRYSCTVAAQLISEQNGHFVLMAAATLYDTVSVILSSLSQRDTFALLLSVSLILLHRSNVKRYHGYQDTLYRQSILMTISCEVSKQASDFSYNQNTLAFKCNKSL